MATIYADNNEQLECYCDECMTRWYCSTSEPERRAAYQDYYSSANYQSMIDSLQTKIVVQEVPVEVIKEVPVEKVVEKVVEKEVIKEVPVEVVKVVVDTLDQQKVELLQQLVANVDSVQSFQRLQLSALNEIDDSQKQSKQIVSSLADVDSKLSAMVSLLARISLNI